MTDRVESFKKRASLTRREFTLEAALALLAGCVITISDACGGSTSPTPVTSGPPADVTGVIADNHGHSGVITGAQITAGNAVTLSIQGTAVHSHTVSITQADLRRSRIVRASRVLHRPTFLIRMALIPMP